jgi:hypothetical protein
MYLTMSIPLILLEALNEGNVFRHMSLKLLFFMRFVRFNPMCYPCRLDGSSAAAPRMVKSPSETIRANVRFANDH